MLADEKEEPPMLGLMQDWPLTVDRILDHAARRHGGREIVSRSVEGPIVRTTYAELHARAKQVSHGLHELGIARRSPGTAPGTWRPGTGSWGSARSAIP